MPLSNYFSELLQSTGAKELVLVADHAPSSPTTRKRQRIQGDSHAIIQKKAACARTAPPKFPQRRASKDDLSVLAKQNQESEHSKAKLETLKDFFGEVVSSPRRKNDSFKSMPLVKFQANNSTRTTTLKSLLVAGDFLGNEKCRQDAKKRASPQELVDMLDEAAEVVKDVCRKEARWLEC